MPGTGSAAHTENSIKRCRGGDGRYAFGQITVSIKNTYELLRRLLGEKRSLVAKLRSLVEQCPSPDAGTLAIEQLLAHEERARAAAFAFAAYPGALAGAIPVGAEGLSDLGRLAAGLLDIEGEIKWQERLSLSNTAHPELARLVAVLGEMEPSPRQDRARQLFYWALVNNVPIEKPATLEEEFNAAVEYLSGRVS